MRCVIKQKYAKTKIFLNSLGIYSGFRYLKKKYAYVTINDKDI